MKEWKQIVAMIAIIVFVGRWFLHIFMFGNVLDDPEFDDALAWAEQVGIWGIELSREYPFSSVTRREAAQWYVSVAQEIWLVPEQDDDCTFTDIYHLEKAEQEIIHLSCLYWFFKGNDHVFLGEQYITKANSLVALMRWLYPWKDFDETDQYRDPYVTFAHDLGITRRPTGPYMMYLVTRYELLLQLYRIGKMKGQN